MGGSMHLVDRSVGFEGSVPIVAGTIPISVGAALKSKLTKEDKLVSVAGGGDTVAALNQSNYNKDFTYISTAGRAFLELLSGENLPGINVLIKN